MAWLSMTVRVASIIGIGSIVLVAQTGPTNLRGEWSLNSVKSDFKPKPTQTELTYGIEEKGPLVTVHFREVGPNGTSSGVFVYTADQQERSKTMKVNGQDATVTESATWDGTTLVVNRKVRFSAFGDNGQIVVETERWNVSPDTRTLTVITEMRTENRDGKILFKVLEKPTVVLERVK